MLRVVVDRLQDDKHNVVRSGIVAALEAETSVDLVSIRLLEDRRHFIDGSPKGYQKLAQDLELTFLLDGRLQHTSFGYEVTVTLFDGSSGKALPRLTFEAESLSALRDEVRAELWTEISALLEREWYRDAPDEEPTGVDEQDVAPVGPEVAPAERSPADVAEDSEDDVREAPSPTEPRESKARSGCPQLTARVGGGMAMRWYDYEDEQRGALRGYTLKAAPELSVRNTLNPFSPQRCNVLSGLGLTLEYARVVSVRSRVGGRNLGTTAGREGAELQFRIPFEGLTFTPSAGYVGQHFWVDDDVVPDVDYFALSCGADLAARDRWLVVEGGARYLHLLGVGELGSNRWFPELTGRGYQLSGALGMVPLEWFEVLAGLRYAAYQHDINARDEGLLYPNGVAQGIRDEYLSTEIAVRFYARSGQSARSSGR